jgi:hypothetical protein
MVWHETDAGGGPVRNADVLIVRIPPDEDCDDEEVAALALRLREQLLDLDVDSVDLVAGEGAEGAKGLETAVGGLGVRLGVEGLRTVIAAIVRWTTRTGHAIEITYGDDTLKVSGVSSAQQERIINDFLARHTPRA